MSDQEETGQSSTSVDMSGAPEKNVRKTRQSSAAAEISHARGNIFEVMAKNVCSNASAEVTNTTASLLDAFIAASQQNMQHISTAMAKMSEAQTAVNGILNNLILTVNPKTILLRKIATRIFRRHKKENVILLYFQWLVLVRLVPV